MLAETKQTINDMLYGQVSACHKEGVKRYTAKDGQMPMRLISPAGERAYRLRHHEFFGLSLSDTAYVMGVSDRYVQDLLAQVREAAPQLFPILPPRAARIYFMFLVENLTTHEIAQRMSIRPATVSVVLYRLYSNREETGLYFRAGTLNRIQYKPWMDRYVKMEF